MYFVPAGSSLPQSLGTADSPTFAGLTITGQVTFSDTSGTAVGGALFGADTNLFRPGAGGLGVNDASGGHNPRLDYYDAGTIKARYQWYTGGAIFDSVGGITLRTNGVAGTAALTLAIDQTWAFAKTGTISVGATTSGLTDLLLNPTAKASGNFIDGQINSSSKFKVDYTGAVTATGAFFSGAVANSIGGFQEASILVPALSMNSSGSYYGQVFNASGTSWSLGYGGSPLTNGTAALTWFDSGTVSAGKPSLATNATDGFLYVPTCAGTPTGSPTTVTGMAPIVVNTTNNKLYFYSTGAWRDAGP